MSGSKGRIFRNKWRHLSLRPCRTISKPSLPRFWNSSIGSPRAGSADGEHSTAGGPPGHVARQPEDGAPELDGSVLFPAQLFETRKSDLDALVARFPTAAPGDQAGMVERITALTQEVFQLAQGEEVLGQDPEGLRGLRNELVAIIDTTSATSQTIFDQAIAAARESRDVLLASLGIQSAIQGYMEQSVAHLKTLVGLVTPTGSFQTVPGQVRPILRTGPILAHAGELIGRPPSGIFATAPGGGHDGLRMTASHTPQEQLVPLLRATLAAVEQPSLTLPLLVATRPRARRSNRSHLQGSGCSIRENLCRGSTMTQVLFPYSYGQYHCRGT